MTANVITQPRGFTYAPQTGELLAIGATVGYAVTIPGTEHVAGAAGIAQAVADVTTEHADRVARGAVIRGTYSPERRTYVIELADILPWSERVARTIGWMRNRATILDLATGEIIPTGGSSDA